MSFWTSLVSSFLDHFKKNCRDRVPGTITRLARCVFIPFYPIVSGPDPQQTLKTRSVCSKRILFRVIELKHSSEKRTSEDLGLLPGRTYYQKLGLDEETFQTAQLISAQELRDLKTDSETALKNRVYVFAAAEEYALTNLAMQ